VLIKVTNPLLYVCQNLKSELINVRSGDNTWSIGRLVCAKLDYYHFVVKFGFGDRYTVSVGPRNWTVDVKRDVAGDACVFDTELFLCHVPVERRLLVEDVFVFF